MKKQIVAFVFLALPFLGLAQREVVLGGGQTVLSVQSFNASDTVVGLSLSTVVFCDISAGNITLILAEPSAEVEGFSMVFYTEGAIAGISKLILDTPAGADEFFVNDADGGTLETTTGVNEALEVVCLNTRTGYRWCKIP